MSLDEDTVFPDSPVTKRREPKRGRRAAASGQTFYTNDPDGEGEVRNVLYVCSVTVCPPPEHV
jgi:hypothetical protein